MTRLIIALLFLVIFFTAAVFLLVLFLSTSLLLYGRKPKVKKVQGDV
jgi:hypothetical protein